MRSFLGSLTKVENNVATKVQTEQGSHGSLYCRRAIQIFIEPDRLYRPYLCEALTINKNKEMKMGKSGKTSFTIMVPTEYGEMLVNRNDMDQTNSLFKSGRAVDHDGIVLLSEILKLYRPKPIVIDVGANFGAFTLGLASIVGAEVHAFEPQRIIFNMLAGSVALNSLTNVYCYHMAVGDREARIEIPQFDYSKPLNFSRIEFGNEQQESLTQIRQHDPSRVEYVSLTTLDRLSFKHVDLLKVDAEGMEMQVIDGARSTVQCCRPILYVEFFKVDSDALRQQLGRFKYTLYQHELNYLGVPLEIRDKLRSITSRLGNPI